MATDKELKNLFILKTLDEHGDEVIKLLTEQINKLKLIKSSELLNSLDAYTVREGSDWKLVFKFMSYGRAIEINWHKNKQSRTQKKWTVNTNELLWQRQNAVYRKRRKDTRWYSKIVYGSLNNLIGKLAYGFTEQEIETLKSFLLDAEKQGLKYNLQ